MRHVYQTSRGGRIYCPLEHHARITRGATPRFASQLSHKYAQLNAGAVQADLQQNHGRKVTRSSLQNVAEWLGSLATAKEAPWRYALPRLDTPIATVVVSVDRAMIPMADSVGRREAMAATLSFYDHAGERGHTLYHLRFAARRATRTKETRQQMGRLCKYFLQQRDCEAIAKRHGSPRQEDTTQLWIWFLDLAELDKTSARQNLSTSDSFPPASRA